MVASQVARLLVFAALLPEVACLSFTSSFETLNGVRHHVRDTGTGRADEPVAVLLHGFTGSTESWDLVAPALASAGCRVIALDRVGFGRTERPRPPRLPALPALPFFRETIAASLEESTAGGGQRRREQGGLAALLPDPRETLAIALRRPITTASRLPWLLSPLRQDPYSSAFAVSATCSLLERRIVGPRRVYFVGHSAGGPLALRALLASGSLRGVKVAGVVLVAPACLDPREDPDAYSAPSANADEKDASASAALRFAAFRTLLSLPDAFGLPLVRRLVDGRDMKKALLGQTHPRMASPENAERVAALAEKYTAPTREFAEEWDTALLNVYRADMSRDPNQLSGRKLLAAARATAERTGATLSVVTGDSDTVVPVGASRKVAALLGASPVVEIPETGHLPMDEKPAELAQLLADLCI